MAAIRPAGLSDSESDDDGDLLTHRWPTGYVVPQDNILSFICCRWRIFIVFLPRSVGPGYPVTHSAQWLP